jgi:ribosome-dependent ATPase
VPPAEARAWRDRLLEATGLAPFARRKANKLSGGMKQKLGLCCALIHEPELLILDEPTTGVDPLSRRSFWEPIAAMRRETPMSVVVATAYMEEAEPFDHPVMMDDGRVLAAGAPAALKARTGAGKLDEVYTRLLPEAKLAGYEALVIPPRRVTGDGPAIEARSLVRRFGDFTAVDDISFSIELGEIFGFVTCCGPSSPA